MLGRHVIHLGALGGVAAVFLCLVGLVPAFSEHDVIAGVLNLSTVMLWLAVGATAQVAVRRRSGAVSSLPSAAGIGAAAGAVAGAVLALLPVLGQAVNLRAVFVNASPDLYALLLGGRGPAVGVVLLVLQLAAVGGVSGAATTLAPGTRRLAGSVCTTVLLAGVFQQLGADVLRGVGLGGATRLLFAGRGLAPLGALLVGALAVVFAAFGPRVRAAAAARAEALPEPSRRALRGVALLAGLLIVLALPHVVGRFAAFALVMVSLYVLMGLGLNIVLGWAGLLDLGFVAFFAIGAYTVGLLTSPEVQWLVKLSFWQAVPFAILASVVTGFFLGLPVLGMRGDYLAIATLGFGEIVRILVGSDFLKPVTGGTQGITLIPRPVLGGIVLDQPHELFYLLVVVMAVILLMALRLRESRLGRAWLAIREDEDVAEALGIDLIKTKLLAFCTGAAFAGMGGAIFAVVIASAYPHSFELLVSINVVALVIVGGMGSIPGVALGALALVGLPELLREFAEFRLLVYGAVLIAMMLVKPEGLWPERVSLRARRSTPSAPPAADVRAPGAVAGRG